MSSRMRMKFDGLLGMVMFVVGMSVVVYLSPQIRSFSLGAAAQNNLPVFLAYLLGGVLATGVLFGTVAFIGLLVSKLRG